MFQTDSDEDVIFVCEKSALKSTEITVDQVLIYYPLILNDIRVM